MVRQVRKRKRDGGYWGEKGGKDTQLGSVQIYKYTNKNIQIYKYTNKNIQINKYTNKNI